MELQTMWQPRSFNYDYRITPPVVPAITVLNPRPGEMVTVGSNYTVRWTSNVTDYNYYHVGLFNKYSLNSERIDEMVKGSTAVTFKITEKNIQNMVAASGGKTAAQIKDGYFIEVAAMKPIIAPNGSQTGFFADVKGKSALFTIIAPSPTPTVSTIAPPVMCPAGMICNKAGVAPYCPGGYTCNAVSVNCPTGYSCTDYVRGATEVIVPAAYIPITTSTPTPTPTPTTSATPSTTATPSSTSTASPSGSSQSLGPNHSFLGNVFYAIGDLLDLVF